MRALWNSYRDAFSGLPREVWLLSAVLLVNRSGTMVLPFLALYVTQELGLSMEIAGVALAAWGVGHLLGSLAGGWLCDVIGPLRIQFVSLLGTGIGFLVMENVRTMWALCALLVVTATFAESFRPANSAALAAFSTDELQPRAVALNRLAVNIGFALAPAIGGPLAAWDYAWLFRVDGATCIVASGLLWWLFRSIFGQARLETEADALRAAHGRDALHPAADRLFLAFLGVVTLFAVLVFQIFGSYPVYLKEVYGIAEAGFGLLMTCNAILILLFEMLITRWAERWRALHVVGLGAIFFGFGLGILPAGHGVAFALLSVAIWTVGEMLGIPYAGAWVARRAGRVHRGKYMGLFTMAWGVAFVGGPSAGAWIYAHHGPDTLWLWVAGLSIVVCAVSFALAAWERREDQGHRVDELR